MVQRIGVRLSPEPLPVFNKRSRSGIDKCLQQIKFYYYPTFINKAANLFYMIAKDHEVENGNKRTAVCALLAFLGFNDYWVTISSRDVVEIARWVVNTRSNQKEVVITGLEHALAGALIFFESGDPIPYELALLIS